MVVAVAAVGMLADPDSGSSTPGGRGGVPRCVAVTGPAGGVAGYRGEQLANAATIAAVGGRMGVPERGWVVAVTAAMQESGLRNLDHGDRDSLGLFQQRPSQGWGSPTQVLTPSYAATQFYRHLLAVPGWTRMSVAGAAQAVQHSGFPGAYARHETAARAVVATIHPIHPARPGGTDVSVHTGQTGAVRAARCA